MKLFAQWRGVSKYMLSDPSTFFDHYEERHGLGYPLTYLLLTVLAVLVPSFLLVAALHATRPALATDVTRDAAIVLGVLAASLWALTIVEASVVHLVAFLFGARGYARSLEAYAFPAVVRYGLWWFPLVNVVLWFYGLSLQVRALANFHDVPAGRAAFAAVVGLAVYLPLAAAVAAVVAGSVLGVEAAGLPDGALPDGTLPDGTLPTGQALEAAVESLWR